MSLGRSAAVLLAIATSLTEAAAAQESRAAIVAAAQADKARHAAPYEPAKAERIAADVQRRLLQTPQGLYPWFDSVYSGGGLTGGAGYRRFVGDRTFVDARGLLSGKAYKLAELAVDAIDEPGPFTLDAVGGWRDATEVSFYGVGGDTAAEAKTNFQLQQAYAGVNATWRGRARLFAQLGVRYENYTLLEGKGSSPSIESTHTADTAPGLGANPTYVRTSISSGLDSRQPSPGYARRGGRYAVTYDMAADQDDGAHSFEILQAELIQHLPVLRENWILSLHGVAKTTLDESDVVPYFLMPSLGSGSTLRAFPSWRFRDRHSLLMSAEWRWLPARLFLDVALFYDAGKVVSRRENLNFEQLEHDWGLGFRFHGLAATPLRIEIARGREGVNLVFSGAAAF
jgi:hypothetical protein